VPIVKDCARTRNPIDSFILAKLEEKGLAPAPEADRPTLIRRATLDVTGLPPTAQEVRDFLAEPSCSAILAVAAPSEMSVSETLDLQERLRAQVGRGLEECGGGRCGSRALAPMTSPEAKTLACEPNCIGRVDIR